MANLWDPVIIYDSTESSYWEAQTVKPDTTLTPLAASGVTGTYMANVFSRQVGTGVREDYAMIGFHLGVTAGPGAPLTQFDAADATRATAAFNVNVWSNIQSVIANDWTWKESQFRHFGAAFPLDKNGLSKPGPVWRVEAAGLAGTNTSPRLPDQVALTTTYRTASRAHWGRNYYGGFTSSSLIDAQLGHATTSTVDLLATSMKGFLVDLANDARATYLWVWSPKYRGACAVDEISVDDTFDVIRSRRAKFPTYRKTYTS